MAILAMIYGQNGHMPMQTEEFRAALDGLGLSQAEFSRLVDAGARTGRRWALGGSIPGSVEMLLLLLETRPELLQVVRAIREDLDKPKAKRRAA